MSDTETAPQRFRKKSLITAVQWFKLGDHPNVVPVPANHPAWNCPEQAAQCGWIKTLEGGSDGAQFVHVGDWIATGTRGENWPIKADIFAATYEPFKAEGWSSIETVIGEIGQIVLGGLPKGAGFVFRADLIRQALQKFPLSPIIPAAKRYCKICDEVRGDDSDAAVSLRRNAFMELSKACDQEGTSEFTPWKSHFTDSDVTGDTHNYVDTGDGKRLWAQDADEIVKRHNESTSEQAPQVESVPELELEQEADGRWIAAYTRFPGVAAYGPLKEQAIWNAAKVLIESEPAREFKPYMEDHEYYDHPDLLATIERLANHGSADDYTVTGIRAELRDALHKVKLEQAAPTPDEKAAKLAELKQAYDCGNLGWSEAMQLYWTWHSSPGTTKGTTKD